MIASYFLFQKPPILGKAPGKLRRARQQASLLAVRTLTQGLERGSNAEDGEACALENDGIFSTESHFEIGGDKRISQHLSEPTRPGPPAKASFRLRDLEELTN